MLHSLPRLLRNGAFHTAAAFALTFLLAAAVPVALSPENPSFAQTNGGGDNEADKKKDKATEGDENDEFVSSVVIEKEKPTIENSQLILSGLVLAFLAIILLTIRHTFKRHIRKKSGTIERITIVVILVMGSLFLIASGYDGTHIAPAFGLFGMIGGYLLGQIAPQKQGGCSCEKCGKSENESGEKQ